MSNTNWLDELEELESVEDFLEYFDIVYDRAVVHVNRLHILQRFSDFIKNSNSKTYQFYQASLQQAYDVFVTSNAQTEKVFKVFRMGEPQQTVIPVEQFITRRITP